MIRAALFAAVAMLMPSAAAGQNTRLNIGGFNGNIGTASVANFDAGMRTSANDMTYTVTIASLSDQRNTSVYVRANAATMGGSKPVSDVEWRRDDLSVWNPLTTSDVLIESRTIQTNGTSWANSLWFRCNLNWTSDVSLAYSTTITITLQVTAP